MGRVHLIKTNFSYTLDLSKPEVHNIRLFVEINFFCKKYKCQILVASKFSITEARTLWFKAILKSWVIIILWPFEVRVHSKSRWKHYKTLQWSTRPLARLWKHGTKTHVFVSSIPTCNMTFDLWQTRRAQYSHSHLKKIYKNQTIVCCFFRDKKIL